MKKILFALLSAAALLLGGCTQIDTGNVGVESSFGQVKPDTLPPGIYFTAFKRVLEVDAKEVPLQIADMKPQTSDKITLADMDVDVYVQIDPSKASQLVTKWPSDLTRVVNDGSAAVGLNYVIRQAREAVYSAVARHASATVHTEREQLAGEIVKLLQASLDAEAGKGLFFVRSANVRNLVTDPALEANIKAAAQAQFKLQEEKNKLENSRIEAERKRVEAQGEADAIRIKAEAVAKQGGAEYVQLQAIQRWDGKMPTTHAGGALPFIGLHTK